jgi:hypothetical protein
VRLPLSEDGIAFDHVLGAANNRSLRADEARTTQLIFRRLPRHHQTPATDNGERPERLDRIVQSWDAANKATELSDFSVCTTRGVSGKHLFLLGVFRPDGSNIRRSSAPCASSRACSMRPSC